uniref:Uncharacterized protein n=1 Tax=Rhizophora mucronata TaxID=61149 RepID=A0A2P2PW25_RHIMU
MLVGLAWDAKLISLDHSYIILLLQIWLFDGLGFLRSRFIGMYILHGCGLLFSQSHD